MKIIRDGQALIGMLESGEFNEDFSEKARETFAELRQLSEDNPKNVHKGSITIKFDLAVANGMVTINTKIDTKTPERARRASAYWITESGELSTEHPQQQDMFTPREVRDRDRV